MAQISVSGTEVYTITTHTPDGPFRVNLVISQDDLFLDHDAVAEAVRTTIVGMIPTATASYNDKAASVDSVVYAP